MANMESIRNFFSIKLLREKFPVMLQFKLFSPERPSLRLHHQNLLFVLYSHLHLGQTQAFQRYPGYQEASEVQEPTPTQAVLSNVATSNSKPKFGTFWAESCWAHRPAGFLNFSTGNLFADPNNVKFWNRKKNKQTGTTEPKKVQNLSLEKIWRERGHSKKGRVRHLQNGSQFHQFCKSLFRLKMTKEIHNADNQVGITCGAIEEASRSSKAINERVIMNFRDKNAGIVRFR